MIVRKFVTQKQYDWIEKKKEEEERLRQEELEAANKKGGKKDAKKAPKKEDEEKMPEAEPGDEASIPIEEVIPEPENSPVDKSEKTLTLKASGVADYAKYEI